MTDPTDPTDDRPPTLEELDRLRLDPAPVRSIIDAGRDVRRRRRTTIASVAAVSVLLVGGGLVSAQVLGEDTSTPLADANTAPTASEPQDLDVTVSGSDLARSVGVAVWDAGEQTVTYVGSRPGGCTPEGSAQRDGTTVALTLAPIRPDSLCRGSGRTATATVTGLAERPARLTVTEDGTTRAVAVLDAPSADLTVTVQRLDGGSLERGEARWDPELRTVSFVPDTTYDACLTDGAATGAGTTLDLVLTEPADDSCFEPAWSALVTIDGLTEAPVDLVVTKDAVSTIVPVDDPAASSTTLPAALDLCPGSTGRITVSERIAPPSWATLDYALRPYPSAVIGPHGPRQALVTIADDDRPLRVLDLHRASTNSWSVSAEVTCGS